MALFRNRGKKGEETWTYIVDLGIDPLTKKRRQVSKGGFEKKKDAQSATHSIEREIEQGTYIKESLMPFEHFAHDWL